jgi:twinkle protein
MGTCFEKLPHSCGSSDALQVFEQDGKYNGYCFACNKYVEDPYGGAIPDTKLKVKQDERQIVQNCEELTRLPVSALSNRKLSATSLGYFGCTVGLSESDGITPVTVNFPYYKGDELVAYKTRLLEPKRYWSIGNIKEADLFGWRQAIATGSKTLFITEGEFDAIALWQSLTDKQRGTKWESLGPPAVISLKNGVTSVSHMIGKVATTIKNIFETLIIVFDQDEPGQKAAKEALKIFPQAHVATIPGKDANECVMQGRSLALANAVLFKAKKPKNTRIVNAATLYEAGRAQAMPGLSWPWKKITELTRGMRFGETYYLGAGVKMGKSELVNSLIAHLIANHSLNCFAAKPEEALVKTRKLVSGKLVGKIFHDPNIPFDYEAYDRANELLGDSLYLMDLYQTIKWEILEQDIRDAVQQYGCRAVLIDPITNLTDGMNSAEANVKLEEITINLAALAKDMELLMFLFCHLKAPENGPPHEYGGEVRSVQFAGSRAMMRKCHYMLGMQGNKHQEDLELRNMRRLILLEDREFGETGYVDLYWDRNTGLFNEINGESS